VAQQTELADVAQARCSSDHETIKLEVISTSSQLQSKLQDEIDDDVAHCFRTRRSYDAKSPPGLVFEKHMI